MLIEQMNQKMQVSFKKNGENITLKRILLIDLKLINVKMK